MFWNLTTTALFLFISLVHSQTLAENCEQWRNDCGKPFGPINPVYCERVRKYCTEEQGISHSTISRINAAASASDLVHNVTLPNDEELQLNVAEVTAMMKAVGQISKLARDRFKLQAPESDSPLFAGDILLTAQQAESVLQSMERKRRRMQSRRRLQLWRRRRFRRDTDDVAGTWGKEIHYVFEKEAAADQQLVTNFEKALEYLSSHTCLKFSKHEAEITHVDTLVVVKAFGCASYLGYIGGAQPLYLASGCEEINIIHHLLGHTLGLFHTHQRNRRDRTVTLNPENVLAAHTSYLLPCSGLDACNTHRSPFDFNSIMRLNSEEFAKAGDDGFPRRVFEPLDRLCQNSARTTIAQPSFYDILTLNKMYCSEECVGIVSDCLNGGFLNPSDCATCLCPDGFEGQYCGDVAAGAPKECGGQFFPTPEWQFIESPDYPAPSAASGQYCSFLIEDSDPNGKIDFEFAGESFGLGDYKCDGSYIELRYDFDLKHGGPRFCGNQAPSVQIESNRNRMMVLLRSDGADTGFKARFRRHVPKPFGKITEGPFSTTEAVDCIVGHWKEWSPCSVSCGFGGTKVRTRPVVQANEGDGSTCPETTETQFCSELEPCAECKTSPWSHWNDCSVTCGVGYRLRGRNFVDNPDVTVLGCEHISRTEKEQCELQLCRAEPMPDETSTMTTAPPNTTEYECYFIWNEWEPCSVTCGAGTRVRTRYPKQTCQTVLFDQETEECFENCRPEDYVDPTTTPAEPTLDPYSACLVGEWTEWRPCSVSCGVGTQERMRPVYEEDCAENAGKDLQRCELAPCTEEPRCFVGVWSGWSACSMSCGEGMRRRMRDMRGECGGLPSTEQSRCREEPCAGTTCELRRPVTVTVADASEDSITVQWDALPCEGIVYEIGYRPEGEDPLNQRIHLITETRGTLSRLARDRPYTVRVRAVQSGTESLGPWSREVVARTESGAATCTEGPWTEWSACSVSCGPGESQRRRALRPAGCASDLDRRACQTQECAGTGPVVVVPSCEEVDVPQGFREASKTDSSVTFTWSPSQCHGVVYYVYTQLQDGAKQYPARDTTLQISQLERGGRYVFYIRAEVPGGRSSAWSPAVSVDLRDTGTQPSSQCVWGEWTDWSDCSVDCGRGVSRRNRADNRAPSCDRRLSVQQRICVAHNCDDGRCGYTPWSSWSACVVHRARCGRGFRRRQRASRAQNEPDCTSLYEQDTCTVPCDGDRDQCVLSNWSVWSRCSASCGSGFRSRQRVPVAQTRSCREQNVREECSLPLCGPSPTDHIALLLPYEYSIYRRTRRYRRLRRSRRSKHRRANAGDRLEYRQNERMARSAKNDTCHIYQVSWQSLFSCLDKEAALSLMPETLACVECEPTARVMENHVKKFPYPLPERIQKAIREVFL